MQLSFEQWDPRDAGTTSDITTVKLLLDAARNKLESPTSADEATTEIQTYYEAYTASRGTFHLGRVASGELAGLVVVSHYPSSKRSCLDALAIAEEYRGRGLGLIALDYSVSTAQSQESDELWLDARPKVAPFYTQNGFKPVEPSHEMYAPESLTGYQRLSFKI